MKRIDEKLYEDICCGGAPEFEDLPNCACSELPKMVMNQARNEAEQKRLLNETNKVKEISKRKLKESEEKYNKLEEKSQKKQKNAVKVIKELDGLKGGLMLIVEKQTLMVEFLAGKLEAAGWQYDQTPDKKCTDAKGWAQKAKDSVYK